MDFALLQRAMDKSQSDLVGTLRLVLHEMNGQSDIGEPYDAELERACRLYLGELTRRQVDEMYAADNERYERTGDYGYDT